MRKPDQSPEPSIEEILASIRKIIADDGVQGKGSTVGPGFPQAVPNTHEAPSSGEALTPPPYPQKTDQRATRRTEDEILELTEDFMLEEQALAGGDSNPPDAIDPATAAQFAEQSAALADGVEERGLETVLSNVAAEVERLSSGDAARGQRAGFFGEFEENEEFEGFEEDEQDPSQTAEEPVASFDAALEDMAETPSLSEEPAPPPQPRPSSSEPARPRMHSRQLWSARQSGGREDAPVSGYDTVLQASRAEPRTEDLPTGGDRWAEGVQMPVPDTGPTMPFPFASESEQGIGLPSPADEYDASDDGDSEVLETERAFVGDFLTRVFGGSPRKTETQPVEEPAYDGQPLRAEGIKGKAEDLARTTVSEFASEKLGAPALADALHADQPFMADITDSLESALAGTEAMVDDAPEFEAAEMDRAPYAELPEAPPPPPETELESYGEPGEVEPASVMGEPSPEQIYNEAFAPKVEEAAAVLPAPPSERGGGELRADRREAREEEPVAETVQPEAAAPVAAEAPQAPPQAPGEFKSSFDAMPSGLEDSIKAMLKPLIVQWLNENLARIVEQAVREEVADRLHDAPDPLARSR